MRYSAPTTTVLYPLPAPWSRPSTSRCAPAAAPSCPPTPPSTSATPAIGQSSKKPCRSDPKRHPPGSTRKSSCAVKDTYLAMTFAARSPITPPCVHGNTVGACLDCYRAKHHWDPMTGSDDDSAGPARNHPGVIQLRESGQNYFISAIANEDHWAICKDKALWGTRLASSKAACEVRADDLVVI